MLGGEQQVHLLFTKPVCHSVVEMGVVPRPAPVPRKRTHRPQPAPPSHCGSFRATVVSAPELQDRLLEFAKLAL